MNEKKWKKRKKKKTSYRSCKIFDLKTLKLPEGSIYSVAFFKEREQKTEKKSMTGLEKHNFW